MGGWRRVFQIPQKRLSHFLISLHAALHLMYFSAGVAIADYLPRSGAEVANNIAEIRVENDGVYVQLEVFVRDASKFEALIPDEWFSTDNLTRPTEAQRLSEFTENGLTIRRSNGKALPVHIKRVEQRLRIDRTTALTGLNDPITNRKFPEPPKDPRVVYVELFYDFEGARPDVIAIAPPMDSSNIPSATIGFVTFDRGVPVANFAFLSAPAMLMIDWNDPWYSRFDSPNLSRHHNSGVTTYLYIEPRELRHETLIRVRDVDAWLDLKLTSGRQLSPEEQARIKERGASLLAERNPVSIGGQSVIHQFIRAELLTIDTAGLQLAEGRQNLSADEAFLGVILSFPWRDLPETVSIRWDMFTEAITQVPATITDPAGPFLSGASPDDPDIIWRNHLLTYKDRTVEPVPAAGAGHVQVPVLSLAAIIVAIGAGGFAFAQRGKVRRIASVVTLAGVTFAVFAFGVVVTEFRNPFLNTPDDADATAVFTALLENISIANLEVTSEDRKEAIAPLVPTRSHSDVAAELDRALALRVPGGGRARVTDIDDLTLQNLAPVEGAFGFSALVRWTALATAGHWGHTHRRVVEYRAIVEVVVDHGVWKLDGITVLETRILNA